MVRRFAKYQPKCEINGKEAVSAITRAKSVQCKQELADVTCLHNQNRLYSIHLPRLCPLKGGSGCAITAPFPSPPPPPPPTTFFFLSWSQFPTVEKDIGKLVIPLVIHHRMNDIRIYVLREIYIHSSILHGKSLNFWHHPHIFFIESIYTSLPATVLSANGSYHFIALSRALGLAEGYKISIKQSCFIFLQSWAGHGYSGYGFEALLSEDEQQGQNLHTCLDAWFSLGSVECRFKLLVTTVLCCSVRLHWSELAFRVTRSRTGNGAGLILKKFRSWSTDQSQDGHAAKLDKFYAYCSLYPYYSILANRDYSLQN